MPEQMEGWMKTIEGAIASLHKNVEKLTEVVTRLAVVDERIKTIFRTLDAHGEQIKDLQEETREINERCVERKVIIEAVAGDHVATTKNTLVSAGVLKVLQMIGSAVVGAIFGYLAVKGG